MSVLHSKNLSWKAKGLYCFICDNQTNFDGIMQNSSEGKESVHSAIKELINKGFIELVKVRDKGRMVRTYYQTKRSESID